MTDSSLQSQDPVAEHSELHIYTSLTYAPLNAQAHLSHVRSPDAGALVLFAGTTRDTFDDRPVANLTYQAYVPLALATLTSIAKEILSREFGDNGNDKKNKKIKAIAITHRLGVVPIGEESILIAVSAAHRTEAWRAGEDCLEEVKRRTEIWKLETFADEKGEAVWRANDNPQAAAAAGDVKGDLPPSGEAKYDSAIGAVGSEDKQKVEHDQLHHVPESMGPVVRPRRPGETGHGAVVHPGRRGAPDG